MRIKLSVLSLLYILSSLFSFANAAEPTRILFLVNEDKSNYEAHRTIPRFAKTLQEKQNWNTQVIEGQGPLEAYEFPGLKEALSNTDVMVVFFRRIALRPSQMDAIKSFLDNGGSLVGIRTANHAFSVRNSAAAPGYEDWWDFIPDYLGHENRGYGKREDGTEVTHVPDAAQHEILKGLDSLTWRSKGSLYLVHPLLDKDAVVLLNGSDGMQTQPVAWTRFSKSGGRVFYTSLGYPDDFENPSYTSLLRNGIAWAANVSLTKEK